MKYLLIAVLLLLSACCQKQCHVGEVCVITKGIFEGCKGTLNAEHVLRTRMSRVRLSQVECPYDETGTYNYISIYDLESLEGLE